MTGVLDWLRYAADRSDMLLAKTGEHLSLVIVSLGLAVLVGVPLGMFAASRRSRRTPVLAVVGILQTIPSLALLALALVLFGSIGPKPAVFALTLYALLPIVRGTVTGLDAVPPGAIEAADALGMTRWQRRLRVEMPLAVPNILAGVRTAAVIGVGVATLAAFVGGGGLGDFINRGLSLSDLSLVTLGAVPAAVLAIVVDGSLVAFSWGLRARRMSDVESWRRWLRPAAIILPTGLALAAIGLAVRTSEVLQPLVAPEKRPLVIGSKKFGENLLLAEITAQLIEDRLEVPVRRKFTLGGTLICHEALLAGSLDLYPEYSGTALKVIVGGDVPDDPAEVMTIVRDGTTKRPGYDSMGLEWMPPFGFDNTYVLTVRPKMADARGWRTMLDLQPDAAGLTAGFEPEFVERSDGYPALRRQLDLKFGQVADMEASLMYRALAEGQVDVISGYATDGRISALNLRTLEDSTGFFPPYEAAIVVRRKRLDRHPRLRSVLSELGGRIDAETMRGLNLRIDRDGEDAATVARDWLDASGLVPRVGGSPRD